MCSCVPVRVWVFILSNADMFVNCGGCCLSLLRVVLGVRFTCARRAAAVGGSSITLGRQQSQNSTNEADEAAARAARERLLAQVSARSM